MRRLSRAAQDYQPCHHQKGGQKGEHAGRHGRYGQFRQFWGESQAAERP